MNKNKLTRKIFRRIAVGILAVLAALMGPRRTEAAFETLGAGARSLAMGGAFTAISDDAEASYTNPAGLVQVRRGEFTAGYGKLYLGLKDNSNLGSGFVGGALPLKGGSQGVLGVGWNSLSLENAYREDTISLSYGREVYNGLFLGASGKLLRRNFGSDAYTQVDPLFQQYGSNTSNTSFDLGAMYRPSAQYSFAMFVRDINQPQVGLAGGDRVPLEFRGAVGYRQKTLVFDGEIIRKDKDILFSSGIEKWVLRSFGLRAGLTAGSRNRREIATGMGYKGDAFSLDYAFVFPLAGIESTAGSHRFSLSVRFGPSSTQKAAWDFENEDQAFERLLEEKAARISSMEKELDALREQNRTEKVESAWVRQKIQKMEDQLKTQETRDLEALKARSLQSKVEEERLKARVAELEGRIRTMTAPRARPAAVPVPAPAVETPPAPPAAPTLPKTYTVLEGDTLQSIAAKLYGDESKWADLYELKAMLS
jgi:LysM repeat protein